MEPKRIATSEELSAVRLVCEALAVQFRLTRGPTRIELLFKDGNLLDVHLHEKVHATALEHFDDSAAPETRGG